MTGLVLQGAVRRQWPFVLIAATWCALYAPLAAISHLTLRTNAFDLSVFDYALWSTAQGHPGFVPFMGHSLLSHHAMPTLWLLWPVYAAFNSPAALIAIQLAAMLAAAILLYKLALPLVDRRVVLALATAFLFSRRSYSAITSVFYVESLEPALIFAAMYAIAAGRRWLYWVLVMLALGCKEDMALYIGAFGLLMIWRGEKWRGAVTASAAAIWLLLALTVVIPAARRADGLPKANPFVQARYGEADDDVVGGAVGRVASERSAGTLLALTGATGLLAWGAPSWLLVAAPGTVVNLAARSNTGQSGMVGHYGWPILPWIFFAAIFGARRITENRPRLGSAVAALLMLWTVADSPLWVTIGRAPWKTLTTTATVRDDLQDLRLDGRVVVQPNLIPHLDHRLAIEAAGRELQPGAPADVIVLCDLGDLWPLGADGVAARVRQLSRDPSYVADKNSGALHVFRRVKLSGPASPP